jgi:ABC-2 type transport system permease protein
MVKSGDFDRLLLRPRHTALQLTGQELTLRRIGRFSQGLLVLLWASHALDLEWTAARYLLLDIAILGGVCFFYALMVVQASFSFWTTEGLEVMNTLTYGGGEAGRYPLTIYHSWFRRFFTYVIPLACISYYPAIGILGRADPLGSTLYFQWAAPGIGFIFLLASLQLWKFGVRHYRSTGS